MEKPLQLQLLFLIFLGLLAGTDRALAQPSAGAYEFRFNLSARSGLGSNASFLRVSGQIGYFLTANSEIGFSGSAANREASEVRGTVLGFYSYHLRGLFKNPRLLPFISLGLGAGFNDRTLFAENNEIGIKYFFGNRVGLTSSVTYQVRSEGDNELLFEFGLLTLSR